MPNFEDGSYGCFPGISLIAKVLAGRCQMRYTRAAVGKGFIPDGMTPKTMTEPADYVMDAEISSITNPVNGECQVTVQINSANVETGFYATCILLYAEDPDEGEVPYTYLVLENGREFIRPSSSATGKLAEFDLIAAVGSVDEVFAVISMSSFATHDEVERMIRQHTSAMRRDIVIPATGWESGAEEAPGKLYVDVAQDGVMEYMVPSLTVLPAYLESASNCGLQCYCQTLSGAVRFYTEQAPETEIRASLLLHLVSSSGYGTGGDYVLPTATADRLGGVMIGNGVDVAPDGTISMNGTEAVLDATASDEEASGMIREVFGTADKT